jgi:hypothetical protein
MNRESKSGQRQRDAAQAAAREDRSAQKTPSTDMQPEDAGTPDSGNTTRGTAAAPVLHKSATDTDK